MCRRAGVGAEVPGVKPPVADVELIWLSPQKLGDKRHLRRFGFGLIACRNLTIVSRAGPTSRQARADAEENGRAS